MKKTKYAEMAKRRHQNENRSSVPPINSILVCETSSALCASSLENFSAVSGSHSLSKAMLHLSLTFLRLVCSEHSIAPPYTVWKRVNFVLTICYSSLSHKKTDLSSVFLKVFCIQ